MTRRLAVIATLALVLALVSSRPATAAQVARNVDLPNGYSWLQGFPTTIHDYSWRRASGGSWVDDRCGTSAERFRIILYADSNFRGRSVVVCHEYTHGVRRDLGATFCEVPLGGMSNVFDAATCNLGLSKKGTANDSISSVRVVDLGRARCLRLFEHADHKGRSLAVDGDVPNLHRHKVGGSSMGDLISSVRRSWFCASVVGG